MEENDNEHIEESPVTKKTHKDWAGLFGVIAIILFVLLIASIPTYGFRTAGSHYDKEDVLQKLENWINLNNLSETVEVIDIKPGLAYRVSMKALEQEFDTYVDDGKFYPNFIELPDIKNE